MRNIKTIITVIVACIVLALFYFYFQGGSTPAGSTGLVAAGGSGSVGSAELSLLKQIESLRIDTNLFGDQVYRSLQDYSVQIPPQNVGRPNPFAPIPGAPNSTTK